MAKQQQLEQAQRKEFARMLYMQGHTQKEIAEKVGVTRNTISAWINSEKWGELKAAKTITRKELVAKMLAKINEKLLSIRYVADCTYETGPGTDTGTGKGDEPLSGHVYW